MNKQAWKLFKEKLPATLQLSGIFSAFILLVYGILYLMGYLINSSIASLMLSAFGIFDFIFMVILISFVVSILSPLIYSYFAANSILDTKDEDKVTVGTFLKTYLLGLHHPLKGQLHIFSSLMWAFVTYLGIFLGIMIISFAVMSSNNFMGINELFLHAQDLYEVAIQTGDQAAIEAFQEYILGEEFSSVLNFPLGYSNLIAISLAFYLFVHKVVINVFRYFPSTTLGGVPAKPLNPIFRLGFKATKKQFYPGYYKTIYPLIILMLAIFFGSYVGLSFVPNLANNIYVLNITSITLTSIILLPFLPVVFNFYNLTWPKVADKYMEVFIQTAQNQIQMFKDNQARYSEMEKSQLDQAEKSIEKTRQMFEDFKSKNAPEENKVNKDDDSSKQDENNDNSQK